MGTSDKGELRPIPQIPAAAKVAPAYLPSVLVVGALSVVISLIIGFPLDALLLLPAKEAGVRGHALGARSLYPFVLPLPLLLPAIGISIWALVVARRGDRKWLGRSRLLAAATILVLALHVISFKVIGGYVARYASGGGGSPPCVHHLRMLSQALLLYAHDHRGALPESLGQAVRSESLPPSILLCTWLDDPDQERVEDGFRTCFVYRGKGQHEPLDPSDILIHERPGIHDGAKGAYAAFGDGHIEWLTDLQYELERSNQAGSGSPVTAPSAMDQPKVSP